MSGYRFECPKCGRKYKANKDLSGRLKRCGECRHNFRIGASGHAPKAQQGGRAAPAVIAHEEDLPIEEVFQALHSWERQSGAPKAFAHDVTFGHFEPTFRVTYDTAYDDHGRKVHEKKTRETVALPEGLGDDARRAAKRIADLPFEHSKDALERLPANPPELRQIAEQLIKESHRPPTGHYLSRRFVVEQIRTWRTRWSFENLEGNAWFYGSPARLHLPDAPRKSSLPAVAATLLVLGLLGGGAWAVKEFGLLDHAPEPVAAPAPAPAAAPAKPQAVAFSKDGFLQLDDGRFVRGVLQRKEEDVLIGDLPVPTWSIEATHLDAPAFLRGESRRLEDLEGRAKAAGEAKREALVGLFLEVQRQRDRWRALEPLCGPLELPSPMPQKRLDALQASIGKLLEKGETVAVANPAAPEVAPKRVELPPSHKIAADLLAQVAPGLEPEARSRIAGGLFSLKSEKLPQSDLLQVAALYLSRADADSGLRSDRLVVKTAQVESAFEGTLEKKSDAFFVLRMPSGQEVTAYREKDAWVARIPGGTRLENAQITTAVAAPTGSGERLRAALDRLPPSRWMSAPAAEQLQAAKAAVASLEKKGAASNDRGIPLVRTLAAAHASAALRLGTPAEILEARTVLQGLGFAESSTGRWERPDDRRAAQIGQLLRDSKAEEAKAFVPAGRTGGEFPLAYRSAAVHLQAPMRTREDVDRASSTLEGALGQAFTTAESKHLLALKGALAGFGICRDCNSGPAKICTTCHGKGTRTEACAACRGLGYIARVGINATGASTCEACGGKPIKGQRPCERCNGKGTISCPKCQGVTKMPASTDLARTAVCPRCTGSGGHGDLLLIACPTCAGMGLQLLPAGAPEATLP